MLHQNKPKSVLAMIHTVCSQWHAIRHVIVWPPDPHSVHSYINQKVLGIHSDPESASGTTIRIHTVLLIWHWVVASCLMISLIANSIKFFHSWFLVSLFHVNVVWLTSLFCTNCMTISSDMMVFDELGPGGSLSAAPNFLHVWNVSIPAISKWVHECCINQC